MEKKMYKTDFILRSIKERYNEYKKYPNILLNYNDILLFFPDYFKVKMELEKEEFVSKEEIDKEFNDNYKNSALYEKLVKLAMSEDEIYEFMNKNKDVKYMDIKNMFDKFVESSISLCELIDYIGHYPTTWPVPNKDEKNPAMEELLEKYDIIVRYHMDDDLDEMQIMSDDVVRIMEKLSENLSLINIIKEKTNTNEWLFSREMSDEKRQESGLDIISHIEDFPLSYYQIQQKSKREEGKKYLRLQHGKNIIHKMI